MIDTSMRMTSSAMGCLQDNPATDGGELAGINGLDSATEHAGLQTYIASSKRASSDTSCGISDCATEVLNT